MYLLLIITNPQAQINAHALAFFILQSFVPSVNLLMQLLAHLKRRTNFLRQRPTRQQDGVIIDSEMMDCYDLNKKVLMTNLVDGEFPMIPAGDSTLQWTLADGATIASVTVRTNWRWI